MRTFRLPDLMAGRTERDQVRQVVRFLMSLYAELTERLQVVNIQSLSQFGRGNSAALADLVACAGGLSCSHPRRSVVRESASLPDRTVRPGEVPTGREVSSRTGHRTELPGRNLAQGNDDLGSADQAIDLRWGREMRRAPSLLAPVGAVLSGEMGGVPVSHAPLRTEPPASALRGGLKRFAALLTERLVRGWLVVMDVRDAAPPLAGIGAVFSRPALPILEYLPAGRAGSGGFLVRVLRNCASVAAQVRTVFLRHRNTVSELFIAARTSGCDPFSRVSIGRWHVMECTSVRQGFQVGMEVR